MEFMNREEILNKFDASGFENIIASFQFKSGVTKKITITKENIVDIYTGENIETLFNNIESEINNDEFLNFYVEYLSEFLTNLENIGSENVIKLIHKDGLSNINLADVSDVSIPNIQAIKNHMVKLMLKYS